MAETTFAVTQTQNNQGPLALNVDIPSFNRGHIKPCATGGRTLLSSGVVLLNATVRIIDQANHALPNGHIGEIAIASSSLFSGYLRGEAYDRSSFLESYYRSGDLGFLWEHQGRAHLFVTGRLKDMIIIAGENHYPADLEQAAESIAGIKAGRSVAFGAFDTSLGSEVLVIGIETQETSIDAKTQKNIAREITTKILERFDLKVSRVAIYTQRFMIKSSAGKIARKASAKKIMRDLGLTEQAQANTTKVSL